MVKKLFRHEFAAYWRVLLPAWIGLMGAAVLGRLVQLFEQNTVMYNIVIRSSIFFYGLAIVVSLKRQCRSGAGWQAGSAPGASPETA